MTFEQLEELFNTPEKSNNVVSSLRLLKDNAGWQIVIAVAEYNVKLLEEQIMNGADEETKEQIDRKRDKRKAYLEVINTPDDLIKRLETPVSFTDDSDPYDVVKVDNVVDKK